ncbi:MAG: hypothetical protein N3D20_01375 [Candidatus Pacearchaeota archaeon]|nr:hypothetical protein [Candidatus Pacearchaeota archaeon]
MVENYERLIEKISKAANLSVEDIERKVEAKKAKLSGLISKEGAAQIVAAELGINLDKERMKISEIVNGMRKANVIGKVIEIFPVRSYNKNGRDGKVANLRIADESGNIRVVLWDTNHIGLIERNEININDVVEISNAGVRNGELHLSGFSDIKKSNEIMSGEIVREKIFLTKKLSDARVGDSLKIRAVIVQVFEPRYFEVCPECRKRVIDGECKIHGKVSGMKRALLNLVLDDGSGTIRCVAFGEVINKIGISEEEIFSLEKFEERKKNLLGEEMIFFGNIKSNSLYGTNEFNVENVEEINAESLIKEMEK